MVPAIDGQEGQCVMGATRREMVNAPTNSWSTTHHDLGAIAIVLALHLALIIPITWTSSPNCDELGHLASGIYHWQAGKFDAYRVNPPLFRLWCTIPIVLCQPEIAWRTAPHNEVNRSEWCLSAQLLNATSPAELRLYLVAARLMALPIVMLGGVSSYLWAHDRYGEQAGLATLILWSFSPNVLSWGATLCPDIGGAAIGICASYTFSRWLINNDWGLTITCGTLQGLSVLTKFTWILLILTTPLLLGCAVALSQHRRLAKCLQGTLLIATSLTVVNLGYGFERTGTTLGEFDFQSKLFRCLHGQVLSCSGSVSAHDLRVPLPQNFVVGIDQQRSDFEEGKSSYLLGQWSHSGWYKYYLICAALKVPLGLWMLLICASLARVLVGQRKRLRLVNTLALWVPLACIAVVVSSQNGFSRHFRYIFPCLPFVFIIAGQAARVLEHASSFRFVGVTSLLWFAASSVSTWPLCHSYFNELAGGPRDGYRFLLDSNIDWGEDVLHAETWLERHPNANPVYRGFVTDDFAAHRRRRWKQEPATISPGWYLVSIHRVMDPADRFSIMRRFRPVDRIAHSTLVYHLKADEIWQCTSECDNP
jgi:hypothetical protein